MSYENIATNREKRIVIDEQEVNPAFEKEPIPYRTPELESYSMFTPPLTRQQRRKLERNAKKK